MGTVAGHKYFFSAGDIAADLSISGEEAAELVRELHKELRRSEEHTSELQSQR